MFIIFSIGIFHVANLYESDLAHKSLHGRVATVDGRKVAGIGGVFRQSTWMPNAPTESFQRYEDYCSQVFGRHESYGASKRLKARSSIFVDDYYSLAMEKADVLVTHEAPSCHPHGFEAIDELARSLGVIETIHGHHHDNLDYRSQWASLGFQAHGVEYRGWLPL